MSSSQQKYNKFSSATHDSEQGKVFSSLDASDTPSTNQSFYNSLDGSSEESINMKNTKVRWIALFLICFSNFGPYFCFDNPQPLQATIESNLGIDDTQYNLLYTLYSLPNIALALVGGLIIDFLGVRRAMIFFSFLTIIGQAIVTYGASQMNFVGLLVGRLLFGIGEESLIVALHTMITKWFKGKELAFAFGINLTVSRMGSSLNSYMTPRIYEWSNGSLYMPFFIGTLLNAGSWICIISLSLLDKRADASEGTLHNDEKKSDRSVNFKDIKSLPLVYFLLLIDCGLLYGSYFGLMDNINKMMQERFGYTAASAGSFILIVYISSAMINPLFGLFVDKTGKRGAFLLGAATIALATHIDLLLLKDSDGINPNYYVVSALLGISLFISTFSPVFWPCISLVVDKKVTGTAFGLIGSMINLAIATVPLAVGYIHDKTNNVHFGYFWTEIALSGIVGMAILISAYVYIVDKKRGGILDEVNKKE